MAKRDYQAYAIEQTFNYLYNASGNGIIVAPTGTGKSHIIAGIVERALHEQPNYPVQMITTSKELIEQNLEKLLDAWPSAPVGVFSAGLNKKQNDAPIIFGGIKSMVNAMDTMRVPALTLIDECHLFSPNADAVFSTYHSYMKKKNPWLRSVGLTATDWRLGNGRLTEPGSFFTDTIVNMAGVQHFNWFIDQGYLVRLLPRPTETRFDMSGVGMSGGDFKAGELERAMHKPAITWQALQEAAKLAHNRRKWLVFAAGVDHADSINDMLNRMGIRSTVVHRGVAKNERKQRIEDYKAGKYQAIVNNNILTTGFDDTGIDCVIVLRPTMSSSLWVQMLGRGTRPHYATGFDLTTQLGRLAAIANSYKPNCLVLDFANNTAEMGPINDPVIPGRSSGRGGEAPIKICETRRLLNRDKGAVGCGGYNHTSVRHCDHCGAEFDFAIKFSHVASSADLITDGAKDDFQWFDVKHVFYSEGVGPSGKSYLRVDYYYNTKKCYTDYVHLEQSGYMLHQAKEWWKARATHPPEWGIPPTVKKALPYCRQYLKQPVKIRVWTNKQPIPEVINYEYE